jgi:hypothetical protein
MSYRITVDQHAIAANRDGQSPQDITSGSRLPDIQVGGTFGFDADEYERIRIECMVEAEPCHNDAWTVPDTYLMLYRQDAEDRAAQRELQYPA